jgi:DNA invertase Pin-like site-specific DNA recombinase
MKYGYARVSTDGQSVAALTTLRQRLVKIGARIVRHAAR